MASLEDEYGPVTANTRLLRGLSGAAERQRERVGGYAPLHYAAEGFMGEEEPSSSVMDPARRTQQRAFDVGRALGIFSDAGPAAGVKGVVAAAPLLAKPMRAAAKALAKEKGALADAVREGFSPPQLPGLLPPSSTGVSFRDLPDEALSSLGKQYGVNLDRSPAVKILDPGTGKTFEIPGGLEGKFSYTDLLDLKSRGINPNEMSKEFHNVLHKKMVRSVDPGDLKPTGAGKIGEPELEVFNRLLFGITSPNNPLTPNEFAVAALRARSREDIEKMARQIDWEPGAKVPLEKRAGKSRDFTLAYGLQAAEQGGLGATGSVDYTNVAELAKSFLKKPEFFFKKPGEDFAELAERVFNQQRGLAPKTGVFGTVWQRPTEATVSAVDRHMARMAREELKATPEFMSQYDTQQVADLWNKQAARADELRRQLPTMNPKAREEAMGQLRDLPPAGAKPVKNYAELQKSPGFEDWESDYMVNYLSTHPERNLMLGSPEQHAAAVARKSASFEARQLRNEAKHAEKEAARYAKWQAKGSDKPFEPKPFTREEWVEPAPYKAEYNPNIPERLHDPERYPFFTPEKVTTISEPYMMTQDIMRKSGAETGQGVFAEQWRIWDRIRNRLEPHEIMYPGLHKLPPMQPADLKAAIKGHSEAGYLASEGAVRATPEKNLRYWSVPAAATGLGAASLADYYNEEPQL